MNRLQVRNRASSSPIEQVATHAEIARTTPMAPSCVREGVLDGDALSEFAATVGRLDKLLQTLLARFVFGDGDGAAVTG